MKLFSFSLCLLLALSICLHRADAATEVHGFAGMAWGSSLQANQQTKNLILSKENDGKGSSFYTLKDVSMRFGQATLSSIECSFAGKRLNGVMLLFSGEQNFLGVKAEATKRYGKPIFIPQKGSSVLSWPGKSSSIILSYTLANESGFLYLKAKKLPPVAGLAQSPSPKRPASQKAPAPLDDLALFDQASGVQQITAQPTQKPFPPAKEAALIPLISSEVQGYIDRDQALTRICWDTLGQVADQACAEMERNQQRLQELGWCREPGTAADGLEVSWGRCEGGKTTAKTSKPVQAGADALTSPGPEASICSLVVELFAAAADLREKGVTPIAAEEALLQRQEGRKPQLRIEQIRETVELVFFDHRYASLPLLPLTAEVEKQCRGGQGPYIAPLPPK
ncbi:hypothetical protein JWJ90_20765 [Desulfobulbus rhabdoformis]|jgi:hypothetical protein|uniref:hypothetical protein n=1 Tax=Desulfobulbus rhabdoformis TaxID=34032 RepID=UPI001966C2D8|nr:hypothetical protein [Desulfobulbus rhabdoformis]MBM9616699.1 hypothetical protein [Desulfobulbus rhabdoformis]